MWIAYVDYVDEMVVDGFFTTIQCSLKFLLDNTSPRPEPASLFEAVLELQVMPWFHVQLLPATCRDNGRLSNMQ